MAAHLFEPLPNVNQAYHCDGTHEYFGDAPRGTTTAQAKWRIFKIEYDTSYTTAGDPWVIKWADGDDNPDNVWDNVASLTYDLLQAR